MPEQKSRRLPIFHEIANMGHRLDFVSVSTEDVEFAIVVGLIGVEDLGQLEGQGIAFGELFKGFL